MGRHILSISLIIILSTAIYANTLKNGFVYDDGVTIVNNTLIKSFGNLPKLIQKDYFTLSGEGTYRPLVTLTYFLDYALYGLKPWGFHLTNILLHIINGVLLYIFLTILIRFPVVNNQQSIIYSVFINLPFYISTLFVSHPVLTEAINAISFREDLLAFLFYMAALTIYISLPTFNKRKNSMYAVSCMLYFFALLSKEMAATLPLIACCYEWVYNRKGELRTLLFNRYNNVYIAITLFYIYLRFYYFLNPTNYEVIDWTLMERLLIIPMLLTYYLKLVLFPLSLSADYAIESLKSLSSLLLICFLFIPLGIFFLKWNKNKGIAFGILFFLITLIPVYNIIPIGNPFAERYLYIPITGLILALVLTVQALYPKFKDTTFMALLLIICCNLAITMDRNIIWRDGYSLWTDTLRKIPGSSRAHNNLGLIYYEIEWFTAALQEFKVAIKLKPTNSTAHNNLGIIYLIQEQYALAIQEFETAIKHNRSYPEAHHNLGSTYVFLGRLDKAILEYQTAIHFRADYAKAHYNLGTVYMKKGRVSEAKMEADKAMQLDPSLKNKGAGLSPTN